MKFDLTQPLPERIEFAGRLWTLRLSFDTVLRVFELYQEKAFYPLEKQELALALLVKDKEPPPELLKYIFENYISITKRTDAKGLKCFDFLQDGAYLYSSFLADYGIDLVEQRGKLHWWKFVALFQGLSDGTKMREVMRIRREKPPEPNKHNAEYIENLMQLKQYYALEITQEEREQNLQNGFERIAQALIARAQS